MEGFRENFYECLKQRVNQVSKIASLNLAFVWIIYHERFDMICERHYYNFISSSIFLFLLSLTDICPHILNII